jgi:glutaredoxin
MMRGAVFLILTVLPLSAPAGMYKWTDAEGNVHYSDQRPPDGAESQTIEGQISVFTPVKVEPSSAGEMRPVTRAGDVVMFTTSSCPYCLKAKAWLRKQGVRFREIDIEQSERNRAMFVQAGGRGVPHTVVNRGGNEIRLRGFDAGAFERVFGER